MDKKRIGVVTATRAEYGLLKNVMREIDKDVDLELVLFVTGTHLSLDYGYTVKQIEEDGFEINEKIDFLLNSDTPAAINKSMGMAAILFSDVFEKQKIDALVILGDRYELLPICQCAMIACIPIIHISGGETTEGAIDESVRHCLTKMSYLHFPSCEEYRKRIIQLGEHPDRVFNYGDVGVENVLLTKFLSKDELENELKYSLDKPYYSVTFHPVTLEKGTEETQVKELLDAIDKLDDYKFVFSKTNADSENKKIDYMMQQFIREHDNCVMFESLGVRKYLSLLRYSQGVLGNSSSGIIEAPILKIPTVNIGNRQKGRLKADSIIDCEPVCDKILAAIKQTQDKEYRRNNCDGSSPYGGGSVSKKIVCKIKEVIQSGQIDLEKKFYDVEF